MQDDMISREATLKPYKNLNDEDTISVWLIRKNIEQQPPITQKSVGYDDVINRILKRMWNCRGKHITSIDKVKMEQIIRDELSSVTSKPIEYDDTVSRGVFEQVRWERDVAIEQLHELGYELGQKIEPCDAISRDAVMRLIENKPYDWSNLTERHNMLMEIHKLPPVTQKCEKCAMNGSGSKYCDNCGQKSGKWIPIPYELDYETDAECSLCHEKFIAAMDYNYCPKCGCRMQKSEDGRW